MDKNVSPIGQIRIGPYGVPFNEEEYSRRRLQLILNNERIRLDPYELSDSELWEYVRTLDLERQTRLVQGVVIDFDRIRLYRNPCNHEALAYRVGIGRNVFAIPLVTFFLPITAEDSARKVPTLLDGRKFHSRRRVDALQGKRVFLSHCLTGHNSYDSPAVAYYMHTLCGELKRDASMIRRVWCETQITMIERVLANPHCRFYLSCQRGVFDFETPLRELLSSLRERAERFTR